MGCPQDLRRSSSQTPKERFQDRQDPALHQGGEGSGAPGFPPKVSPLLVPGGSLLPIGRVEVRTDPRKYRHKLRGGETRPRSPNFSPASHHRGGYSTAWTVADRRMHLQDPLGHKRLQTFPCEESRGRTSEGAGRAQVGPGTRARFRGAVRVKARFPPTTTMNTRLRPTSEPSARPRGSPYPRGRRGDLQSSETQDPVSAPA